MVDIFHQNMRIYYCQLIIVCRYVQRIIICYIVSYISFSFLNRTIGINLHFLMVEVKASVLELFSVV